MATKYDNKELLSLGPANPPSALLPGPSGQMVFNLLPSGSGFQLPLPENADDKLRTEKSSPDLDWHCYLGSR